MRRNFYNIHQYNKKLYLHHENIPVSNTKTRLEISIPHGSYDTFDKLATAIQLSLRAAIASATQPFVDTFDQTIGEVGESI